MLKQTPSQTVGPYFAYALTPEAYGKAGIVGNVIVSAETAGEHIRIEGRVLDGAGNPVNDALVEIWQADAYGRFAHPGDNRNDTVKDPTFKGFGRAATDKQGFFWLQTVKPGRVPGRGNAMQAPHISVTVLARGMLNHLFTRLYFSDETEANESDPVLSQVEAERRGTLVATRRDLPGGPVYRFDIRLQGDDETVFFDA